MLVITGAGRSGTTLIAQWLDELKLLPYKGEYIPQFYSGLSPIDVKRVNSAIWIGNDAPMQSIPAQEAAIREFDYSIVKDSMFFHGNVLDTWLSVRKDLKFFICIRNFSRIEKSRRDINQINKIRNTQELESDFGKFLSNIIFNKLPYEIVEFPDFTDSYDEVYDKITRLEPDLKINRAIGKKAWEKVVKKELTNL